MKNSRVLIVGAGGLGCPVATYLGAAGVGTLGIIDYDHVTSKLLILDFSMIFISQISLDNLQRQVAYKEAQIGHSKAKGLADNIKL